MKGGTVIALGIGPTNLFHPNPSKYVSDAEKIDKETARYIAEFEKRFHVLQKISRAPMVGSKNPEFSVDLTHEELGNTLKDVLIPILHMKN